MIDNESIKNFIQQSAPRRVTRQIKKNITGMKMGSTLFVLGIIFFLFGSIFSYVFFPTRLMDEISLNSADKVSQSRGEITYVSKTNMSEGGSKHRRGTPVYQYGFQYNISGRVYSGECYTTGKRFEKGKTVNVLYVKDNPTAAKLSGARVTPFGLGSCFVLIFPIVGFGLALVGFLSKRGKMQLLKYGSFAVADIELIRKTNTRVNNQYGHKVTFRFEADGHTTRGYYTVYGSAADQFMERMECDEQVGLLYNPLKPSKIIPIAI